MNRRDVLAGVAATAVFLIGLSAPGTARAQQTTQRPGGFGGAPFMFGGGGPLNALRDPARSNLTALLDRNDVRNEIGIDGRQRDALNDLKAKSRTEMADKMRANFQNMREKMRDLSPEDRRAEMQKMQSEGRDAINAYQTDMDKRVEAILRPAQLKRLHELDLQWRGPLALVDPQVADKVGLDPDQRTKVAELHNEYRDAQTKAFQSAFAGMGRNRRQNPGQNNGQNNQNDGTAQNDAANQNTPPPDASPPPTPPTPPTPQEMQARMLNVQKEMDKARTTIGAKALALLTPEELQNWRALLGKPFTFNTND